MIPLVVRKKTFREKIYLHLDLSICESEISDLPSNKVEQFFWEKGSFDTLLIWSTKNTKWLYVNTLDLLTFFRFHWNLDNVGLVVGPCNSFSSIHHLMILRCQSPYYTTLQKKPG